MLQNTFWLAGIVGEGVTQLITGNPKMDFQEVSATEARQAPSGQRFNNVPLRVSGRTITRRRDQS